MEALHSGRMPLEHRQGNMPKKKYQVIKATTREIPGVYVGGKERRFGKNGTFTVSDKGEAEEINKVLGAKGKGDVVVIENKEKETGHTYKFGASSNFANAWDEFKKRQKKRLSKKRNTRRTGAEVTDGKDLIQSHA